MTVDSGNFGPDIRSAVRRHWVLLLIPGVIMMVLGLLAAASPLVSTLVVDTASGFALQCGGILGFGRGCFGRAGGERRPVPLFKEGLVCHCRISTKNR